MSNRTTNIIAAILLTFMAVLAITSMAGDSLTMDELAHLPAGYSYLTQKDMRLNPEHPPLIKDLSALPLLFVKNINFPSEIKDWKEDINGQWGFGNVLLFKSGNPADQMIFWGRIPMILILLLLGFYVFRWTKELFGNKASLLALFFYSFSPTFLAHGRLVTTDVGAAAGAFIATYYFVKFLQNSSWKNLLKAGIFFGLAELAKFSLILLLPLFGLLVFFWPLANYLNFKNFARNFAKYLSFFLLVLIIGGFLIWLVYLYHTWGYPPERQLSDTQFTLKSFGQKSLSNIVIWMSDKPILRPAAQYLFGLFMVLQRASGGNTGYFMGEVSAAGWKTYFPTVYLLKEPLAFHVLLVISILFALCLLLIKNPFWRNVKIRLFSWLKNHFPELAMLLFIAIYWGFSLKSSLNIGVRHLLPVFPFTIILVASTIMKLIKQPYLKVKVAILFILLLWQAVTVISVYPSFLTYFNELAGGPQNGYNYAVDSNYDWGQDLKRLKRWVDENNIDKIYIDYFGGADAPYYFQEKYAQWWGDRSPEELPKGSYLAVSATFLQNGQGKPVPGFNQPTGYYLWLNKHNPVARIGNSIFVYKID